MADNIINYDTIFKAPQPEILVFQSKNAEGMDCQAAVATGLVPMSLNGRTHSFTYNIEMDIEFPFEPAAQVVSLSARGQELRGLARIGFRKVGWSIVDYSARAEASAVRVTMSLWVNNRDAWSLGVIYNCTALSVPLKT